MITPPLPRVAYEQIELPNGLRVLFHEDLSAPLAALVVMYHVGSKNESPGRTGFAHLFEHVMFKGSAHVADGEHFRLLQEIGATVNGSTSEDRTNYFEVVPATHLELAIYLESDRMGFLLPALTQEKLDNQRDVVRNERRQHYDNQPYGRAHEVLTAALFPASHPYSWPVIGSMEDLAAATLDDVKGFFQTYYSPANACVSIAGNFDRKQTLRWIERYFGTLPANLAPGPVRSAHPSLASSRRMTMEDHVRLPRVYIAWHGPRGNTREDAVLDLLTNLLCVGRNSLLHRSLVYRDQIAQDVVAYQDGMELAGMTGIVATARPDTPLSALEENIESILGDAAGGRFTQEEFYAALTAAEVHYVESRVTAYQRANGLATHILLTGDAENYNRLFSRYAEIGPHDVQQAAARLLDSPRVTLSVVPQGKPGLAAAGGA